jgi:hypothetical protein
LLPKIKKGRLKKLGFDHLKSNLRPSFNLRAEKAKYVGAGARLEYRLYFAKIFGDFSSNGKVTRRRLPHGLLQ